MNSENVTKFQSQVAERHHLGRHTAQNKIWVVDRSFGILTRNTFHFVLYLAKKRTHTHTDNVVQNS